MNTAILFIERQAGARTRLFPRTAMGAMKEAGASARQRPTSMNVNRYIEMDPSQVMGFRMLMKSYHRRLSVTLEVILLIGVVVAVWNQQWDTAGITIGIILITLAPLLMKKRFRVHIPPEFELFAVAFVFASLFLGEVHGYYTRFWWWDIALHTSSGLLMGIMGFLLVHLLNETDDINLHMTPGFVAFFSFVFAIGVGTLWEIFEFGMDSIFGATMQKPMLGDPSGLTDTMWDMIVNALGALFISTLGYGYLKTAGNKSFLERWINAFIKGNPRFFGEEKSNES